MSALAIVIDPWIMSNKLGWDTCVKNITDFCQHDDTIAAVALAPYSTKENHDAFYVRNWAANSDLWFSQETKWDRLRKEWKNTTWNLEQGVDPKIANMSLRLDQVRFLAYSDLHILYYCTVVNPGIDSIYFLGQSWDICVKYRPVGWLQIASLQYHNLLNNITLKTKQGCVYDLAKQAIAEIPDPWIKTDSDGSYSIFVKNIF
jgi:hypothetical protein